MMMTMNEIKKKKYKKNTQVDGEWLASPEWVATQEKPACDSEAHVYDSRTIAITWNTSVASTSDSAASSTSAAASSTNKRPLPPLPRKWTPIEEEE
jgi:hypothetical protein